MIIIRNLIIGIFIVFFVGCVVSMFIGIFNSNDADLWPKEEDEDE